MTTTSIQIQLPSGFGPDHERVVIDYLVGRLSGREAWARAFEAFDVLDQAVLATARGLYTFRTVYQQMVDRRMADAYLGKLLALQDVKGQSPALWSRFARQIASEFTQRGWRRSIDGDTAPGHLNTVVEQLPTPVRIRHRGHELVVVGYEEWKRCILRLQRGEAR